VHSCLTTQSVSSADVTTCVSSVAVVSMEDDDDDEMEIDSGGGDTGFGPDDVNPCEQTVAVEVIANGVTYAIGMPPQDDESEDPDDGYIVHTIDGVTY
jgi:hypothetical protein